LAANPTQNEDDNMFSNRVIPISAEFEGELVVNNNGRSDLTYLGQNFVNSYNKPVDEQE